MNKTVILLVFGFLFVSVSLGQQTESNSQSESPSDSQSPSFSQSPSDSQSPSFSQSPSDSKSQSFSQSPSDSQSPSFSQSPSDSQSGSYSRSESPSESILIEEFACPKDVFKGGHDITGQLFSHPNSTTYSDVGITEAFDDVIYYGGDYAYVLDAVNELWNEGNGFMMTTGTADENVKIVYLFTFDDAVTEDIVEGLGFKLKAPFDGYGVYLDWNNRRNEIAIFGSAVGVKVVVNVETQIVVTNASLVLGLFDAVIPESNRDVFNGDGDIVSVSSLVRVGSFLRKYGAGPLLVIDFKLVNDTKIDLVNDPDKIIHVASRSFGMNPAFNTESVDDKNRLVTFRLGNGIDDAGMFGSSPRDITGYGRFVADVGVDKARHDEEPIYDGLARFRFVVRRCNLPCAGNFDDTSESAEFPSNVPGEARSCLELIADSELTGDERKHPERPRESLSISVIVIFSVSFFLVFIILVGIGR